jgi:membrane protein DedA with SNARE-associated domain
MVDPNALPAVLSILQTQGYWVILLLMIIEGPTVAYIAAFAAALGIFNVYVVFILSVLGNQIPDMIYYHLGKFSRLKTIERYMLFFGFNKKRIKWTETHLKNHAGKTIVAIKLFPLFPGIGLFLTGFMKVKFKKFFLTSLIFNVTASLIFTLLGFYSGVAINEMSKYFKTTEIILPLLLVLVIAFYLVIKFIAQRLSNSKLTKLE